MGAPTLPKSNQYGTQEGYSKEGPCQEEDGRQEAGQEDYCQEGPCQEDYCQEGPRQEEDDGEEVPRQEEDHQEVNERSAKHHHVAAPMAHPSASLQRYNAAHNVGTATSCADCA